MDQSNAAEYSAEEIADAQDAIDTHPNASPFWDSDGGQEALRIARIVGLMPTTTNRERAAIHAKAMAEAERSFHDFRDRGDPDVKTYPSTQPRDLDTFGRSLREGS